MARQGGKFCPGCGERVQRAPAPFLGGWALMVEAARLIHAHRDGSPLCPDMISTGYQPALPVTTDLDRI